MHDEYHVIDFAGEEPELEFYGDEDESEGELEERNSRDISEPDDGHLDDGFHDTDALGDVEDGTECNEDEEWELERLRAISSTVIVLIGLISRDRASTRVE
jgi:hypothetical protein